jgi:hypothetical protein
MANIVDDPIPFMKEETDKKMANIVDDPFAFMIEEMEKNPCVELADQMPGYHHDYCNYEGSDCPTCKSEWEQNIAIDRAYKKKYGDLKERMCFRGGKCDC